MLKYSHMISLLAISSSVLACVPGDIKPGETLSDDWGESSSDGDMPPDMMDDEDEGESAGDEESETGETGDPEPEPVCGDNVVNQNWEVCDGDSTTCLALGFAGTLEGFGGELTCLAVCDWDTSLCDPDCVFGTEGCYCALSPDPPCDDGLLCYGETDTCEQPPGECSAIFGPCDVDGDCCDDIEALSCDDGYCVHTT